MIYFHIVFYMLCCSGSLVTAIKQEANYSANGNYVILKYCDIKNVNKVSLYVQNLK
jgi:hypothetical protein